VSANVKFFLNKSNILNEILLVINIAKFCEKFLVPILIKIYKKVILNRSNIFEPDLSWATGRRTTSTCPGRSSNSWAPKSLRWDYIFPILQEKERRDTYILKCKLSGTLGPGV
jgi:hypothetical protein